MRFRGLLCLLAAGTALAGPIEFGLAEFGSALAARGMQPGQIRVRYEIGMGAPGSWRIENARVTGGDLEGAMYGLLEAAAQVRARGWLSPARGAAALAIRGVRLALSDELRGSSIEERRDFLRTLARSRINRLKLVTADPEAHLDHVNAFAKLCAEHAVELVLAIPLAAADGLELYSRVKTVLARCPLVRSIQLQLTREADGEWLLRALGEAGRRVTVELDRVPPGFGDDTPVRLARPFIDEPWAAQPAHEAYFEVPSPLDLGAPVWADPVWTRYIAGVVARAGGLGFEVDAPWPHRRHWAFFLVWGMAGYDPDAIAKGLSAEFERRFAKAKASDLVAAWTSASRAFTFASLLKPGRWIATEEEAARARGEGTGSAKLAPSDIATAIAGLDAETRKAIARAEAGGTEVEDAANLLVLLETARQRSSGAGVARKAPPKPEFLHFPPKAAPARIAFQLGLIVKPATNVRRVRLHYRWAGDGGEFRTMEAAESRPWFSLTAPADLTYYFEVVSNDGGGWFHPDPLAGTPYFHLPVRERRTEPAAASNR